MEEQKYNSKVTIESARKMALEVYNLHGEFQALPGEIDFNFKVETQDGSYILKISRSKCDIELIDFQYKTHQWIHSKNPEINIQKPIADSNGKFISIIQDEGGRNRKVRLFTWQNGRLWSHVNPHSDNLLMNLGQEAGKVTRTLNKFNHPYAKRNFEWDIAQALWVTDYLYLFDEDDRDIITYFLDRFRDIQPLYKSLRKSIVHNDVNDNNIVVSDDLSNPKVQAIIDYGDAVYTQTINDLAILIAYAAMDKPDPLKAAFHAVKGYHTQFPLEEEELELLYILVAVRLVISVTKSAINKKKEPENTYLQVSEKQAWELLKKWKTINENFAKYLFRSACGMIPVAKFDAFSTWASRKNITVNDLFKDLSIRDIFPVDMSLSSPWLGSMSDMLDHDLTNFKIKQIKRSNPNALVAGGYLETRPFYTSPIFRQEGNMGYEYRSTHLGIDFWVKEATKIFAIEDGEVYSVHNNNGDKDYGPTIILKHRMSNDCPFYILYGHLSEESLQKLPLGAKVKKGDVIGQIGSSKVNGGWIPHLHFQIILDMCGYETDFPGVAYYEDLELWKAICPNPNLIFKNNGLKPKTITENDSLLNYRQKHLGKSLSLSYNQPLHIVRGDGAYLIDIYGQKYLDTVNNVAHVGHEHPRVIKAGQEQMAILNTNTRYLHENINLFAKELLKTFPNELSVVHFVNSGSEANELALRMAKVYTNQKDVIAMEVGYHGNTSGCIDVSSYKFEGKGGKGIPEHTHIAPLPDSYRGLYQGEGTGSKYANHVAKSINKIKEKGRGVAAFICESIISCGGQIELPENFLKAAYKSIKEAGGVCIADEVQVGCGRVGTHFWGFQLHGVIPDIVTIGKPIGNGHPLAAVVCTQEITDAFANGMEYFNTFGGNPVSCAIGREVLQVIQDEKLQENALTVGNYLKVELLELKKVHPVIGDVRGQGLFLGFELVNENKEPQSAKAAYLANRMKELGILMSTDGKDVNVLKIKPPIVFSKENADELIARLKIVLNEDFMKAKT